MIFNPSYRNVRLVIGRLTSAKDGIAAVEFALILPMMLALFLGAVQVTQAVAIKRLVVLTASTVANLVTQYPSISASATMPDILNASKWVLTPYPNTNAVITVSLITIDSSGTAKVTWSQALNGSARAAGQTMALPAALDVPSTSLILGETNYGYHDAEHRFSASRVEAALFFRLYVAAVAVGNGFADPIGATFKTHWAGLTIVR